MWTQITCHCYHSLCCKNILLRSNVVTSFYLYFFKIRVVQVNLIISWILNLLIGIFKFMGAIFGIRWYYIYYQHIFFYSNLYQVSCCLVSLPELLQIASSWDKENRWLRHTNPNISSDFQGAFIGKTWGWGLWCV